MEQDKKFKCNKCGKTFKFKSILLLHSMKFDEVCPKDQDNNLKGGDNQKIETETNLRMKKQTQVKQNLKFDVIDEDALGKRYKCQMCDKKSPRKIFEV